MPSQQHEPTEAQIIAMQKRQAISDAYFRVFSTHDGQQVLKHMQARAFYGKSTFWETGLTNHGIRDYREGQRSFMLETDALILAGREGRKPPTQAQAVSRTAEPKE